MVFMNAPTKTINTFLVNVINRAPIPQSLKNAIGNDPLSKLKSMRSTLTSPKELLDKLPLPDSVKASVQSALPSDATAPTDAVKSKVTFAPETTDESIVVPMVAAAAATAVTAKVVSKTVVSNPEPVVEVEKVLPNESVPEPEVATRTAVTAPPTFSVFSYLPSYLSGGNATEDDKDSKKATIQLDAADLAAVQAYLKQKGTDHKVIQ